MDKRKKIINLMYSIVLFLCVLPFFSPAIALLCGIVFAYLGMRQPEVSRYSGFVLQLSVVMMGFGMNFSQVVEASQTGLLITASSVLFTMLMGLCLTWVFKVDRKTGLLIASGTAICGGSAIAAVAPCVSAKDSQISISLVVVFVLNAVALLIFPLIGHTLGLSEETFGYWSAIAIHDTSSVVGAGASYGEKALEIATTVKLTRALWIIPLSLVITFLQPGGSISKIKIPWFIFLFVLGMVFAQLFPQWSQTFSHLNWMGQKGLVVALFLIGSNIVVADIKAAGIKGFMLGVVLWFFVAVSSLLWFIL